MTATMRAGSAILDRLQDALLGNALPGELDGFTPDQQVEAAQFIAEVAGRRKRGELSVRLESTGGEAGRRRMRMAIINDDMPFLVDSVANAIAGRQLTIHRLLHPVVCVERDGDGNLKRVETKCGDDGRESMMYIEIDRADARGRRELLDDIRAVLGDVRAAVRDWPAMQRQMRADAATIADPEGAALLDWFADGAMTLLAYHVERPGEEPSKALGLFSIPGAPTDKGGSVGAIRYFERGGAIPLIAKAERKSTVHRRVPLDLVVVPLKDGDKITGIGVHAGLWTSQALIQPTEEVPLLRRQLKDLDKAFGFDPRGHSGKALRHAIASVPRDLLINLSPDSGRELVTMAMSLADRPRPALLLVRSILKGHLFAFAWLPRDELNTRRRIDIGQMLEEAAGRDVTSWSVELGEGDLALIRYTLDIESVAPMPDVAALNRQLDAMVRGWRPNVEEALIERVGPGRATRLALSYAGEFPENYCAQTAPSEAAEDIIRLQQLAGEGDRDARFYRDTSDAEPRLRLKIYRRGGLIPLSDAVPVLENFGFRVLEEIPTELHGETLSHIHDCLLELPVGVTIEEVLARASVIETAIADVLGGLAENDAFNQLVLFAGLDTQPVVWLRSWFRYLRQTGVAFGIATVVDALRRARRATAALVDLFTASHDPAIREGRDDAITAATKTFDKALVDVRGIDDDRILRLMRAVIGATLRTNAFAPAAAEALAFKIDSKQVPGLPAPIPYREIWVYSPRVEGIHLRGGPIARGGLRWSDRRDDFRTEILGLMKAQLVKNAVIVPTGAKGGFYPKQLLSSAVDRDAWLAEGTESYRIFIRALLSITDNIVSDRLVHPEAVVIHDGEDPYFVVAADKGTATFSDVANAIALERNFWLGDAFASGGSNGYDHKAMGITAKGAWISVQRHFLEQGLDVQREPIRVAGCGDMSGDVFGNGMLLSECLQLVAAFDHRHIFIDPNPDPARSFAERKRMFELPRSSWDDYDRSAMSKGAMIVPRSQKSIDLTPEAREALGIEARSIDPSSLISAILKSPVDLLWFGGIGTYIKASTQTNAQVGDPVNDPLRVDASEVRAKVIGEGANLAINQAGRIEFATLGGRINTDFIDNSAGVDCSDNEVNIKIPLNREMVQGRLAEADRNKLLASMTDEVSELVLEDNRLQSLALSIAEARGPGGIPGFVRTIEILEAAGRLDRKVEGLDGSDVLLRRKADGRGLTRPELAVVLSMSKIHLEDAAEELELADDPTMEAELMAAFPKPMQKKHGDAIRAHRLRHQIVATKVANRLVNRLGPSLPLDMTEEEGVGLPQVITAYLVAERLLDLKSLWTKIENAEVPERSRIALFSVAAKTIRSHIGDVIRAAAGDTSVEKIASMLRPYLEMVAAKATGLIRAEVRGEAATRRAELEKLGADKAIVDRLVRLYELDGVFGIAGLAARRGLDELAVTRGYTRLGEVLGLDWAQQQVSRFAPTDNWERLLTAGLIRDFEQVRIDFLSRTRSDDPDHSVERWVESNPRRIAQFRALVDRARRAGSVSAPMLAQIASQARILLSR